MSSNRIKEQCRRARKTKIWTQHYNSLDEHNLSNSEVKGIFYSNFNDQPTFRVIVTHSKAMNVLLSHTRLFGITQRKYSNACNVLLAFQHYENKMVVANFLYIQSLFYLQMGNQH